MPKNWRLLLSASQRAGALVTLSDRERKPISQSGLDHRLDGLVRPERLFLRNIVGLETLDKDSSHL